LIGLQYKIIYRKGSDNRVAHALSRHLAPPDQLMTLSTYTPVWLQTIQEGYQQDPKAQQMLSALTIKPDAIPHFTLLMILLHTRKEYGLVTIYPYNSKSFK
jgi:hypothetical protein